MIPFSRPSFGEEEKQAANRVIESGFLTQGPEVEQLENELAAFLNSPYVVCVDNCTNALFLSFEYLNITQGLRHVECPAMTFASVAHVLGSVWGVDLSDEYHAGSKYELKGNFSSTNVWDCAHEIYRGMYKPGQVQCFSFYPNKVLSGPEGGAIATDNKEFRDWLILARNNGRAKMATHDYSIEFPGWKMNMTDLQAAIIREQLKKVDSFNEDRLAIKTEYNKHFEQFNDGCYLYVIRVENRDDFIKKMKDDGVECSYHYKPLYDQPAYKQSGTNFPYCESIKNKVVTLPLYPSMTNEEVQTVINLTKKHAILT